ncbi:beta-ketoacyl synthase [Anopheles sinensis]|uniref:Beta-ketoacyl synthase n=1 Tax=Anopheles sinensis TaxID=74873 RepID=A0A084WUM6_ANOSI|nr:beta-ketoacyl synthase [Anopheles sinensis]
MHKAQWKEKGAKQQLHSAVMQANPREAAKERTLRPASAEVQGNGLRYRMDQRECSRRANGQTCNAVGFDEWHMFGRAGRCNEMAQHPRNDINCTRTPRPGNQSALKGVPIPKRGEDFRPKETQPDGQWKRTVLCIASSSLKLENDYKPHKIVIRTQSVSLFAVSEGRVRRKEGGKIKNHPKVHCTMSEAEWSSVR